MSHAHLEDLAEKLAARTLELIDVPSVSGEEAAILTHVGELMPQECKLADEYGAVLCYVPEVRRSGAPFVVLAGHVDTVPIADNVPGVRDAHAVLGRGAADMKGALAVMLQIAQDTAVGALPSDLDMGFLFFGREELPITESALLPLFERCPLMRTVDLAVVMEPTDNTIQVGCLGNLNARVVVHGAAAHSARPWLGENAIHTAIRALGSIADLPIRDVQIEDLTYREVVSVITIQGGVAANVIPDRVQARLNYRYAPTHTPAEAEARLRELLGRHRVELEIIGNAPPGPVSVRHPLLTRLRATGDLPLEPKQAWTPVAEFATVGVDAVNFGPGDPQYAHRDDERIDVAALVRSYDLLAAFLRGAATEA